MKLTILLSVLFASLTVSAHQFHSENFCSETTKDMCAHIGYDKQPVPNEDFNFVVDFVNKEKVKDISDVEVFLAAKQADDGDYYYLPTDIEKLDAQHWKAGGQQFTGALWGVLVTYKYQGNDEEIFIITE
ncbi:hypothetical protein CIK05_00360 [Bdellovibrio sp. qaytius]|nr:hypothetical protein CIK05_00360 [Bdellovibrio sp. qaytius]